MCGGATPDHHSCSSWVEVELPAFSESASRCLERSDEGVSASEAEGFCGRYHSFHGTAKVDKEINRGEGFETVNQGRRKGRRNQCGCVMQLEGSFRSAAREKV